MCKREQAFPLPHLAKCPELWRSRLAFRMQQDFGHVFRRDGLMNLKRFWSVFEVTLHKWYEFKTNERDLAALKSFPLAKTTPPFV